MINVGGTASKWILQNSSFATAQENIFDNRMVSGISAYIDNVARGHYDAT